MKILQSTINLHLHSIHNLSLRSSPNTPVSVKVYFDDDDDLVQHSTDMSWPTKNSTVTFVEDTTANITLSLCSAARAHNAKSDNPRMIVKTPCFMTLSVHAHPSILSPEKSTAIAIGKVELKNVKRRNKTLKTTAEDIPLSVAGAFVRMTASLSATAVYVRITVSLAVFVKKRRNSEQDRKTTVGDTTYEPVTISLIEETSSEDEDVVAEEPEAAQNRRNMGRENGGRGVLRWTTMLTNIVTGVDNSTYMDVLQSSCDNTFVRATCGTFNAAKEVVKCSACGLLGDSEDEEDQDQDEGECEDEAEREQVEEIEEEVTTKRTISQLTKELLVSAAEEVIGQKIDKMRESSKNNSVTPHPTNQNLI